MEEVVVLVDEMNNVLGTAPKATVHTKTTPLHRGFSLFVFNAKGQLLLTRRADNKKAFPSVWTNTVCGHPAPDERPIEAAERRLKDELGMTGYDIEEIQKYRYCFADQNGIVENEICPILMGYSDDTPNPNPSEISAWKWIDWNVFLEDMQLSPEVYSPWAREEALFVDKTFHMLHAGV